MKTVLGSLTTSLALMTALVCRSEDTPSRIVAQDFEATNSPALSVDSNSTNALHADTRMEQLLKAANISYGEDPGGNSLVVPVRFAEGDDGLIAIHISCIGSPYATMEMREISTVAYRYAEEVPADAARALLKRNSVIMMGAWSIDDSSSTKLLTFSVKADMNTLTATNLDTIIKFITVTATGVRKEISEKGKPVWPLVPQ